MMMASEQPQATKTPAVASLSSTEEPKPKTPFEAAAKVVRSIQLEAVRFHAISARALEPPHTIPADVTFVASTKFVKPRVISTEDGFSTKTTLVFLLGGELTGSDSPPKRYAVIQATLEARYTMKSGAPKFADDELNDYALCYCPFHVWGYWREFVQSSLARLDLPQFTIPLFLIHQAPQMVVQDKPEQ